MSSEPPQIVITFPDGSTYEPAENYRKAIFLKIESSEAEEFLENFVESVKEHWDKETVPTKFNKDNSWLKDWKDKCRNGKRRRPEEDEHLPEDLSWMPETGELARWAEERIDFDEKVKEIFGEDWEHKYPRSYAVSDEREKKDDYPKVFQVQESGETIERRFQNDLTLPKVDEPTWWSNEDSLSYIILPSDLYKEWEDLLVERSKAKVKVEDEVTEKAEEKMPQPYFENMADLASKVLHQEIRLGVLSIAMEEITEDNSVEIIGLGEDKITHYKGRKQNRIRLHMKFWTELEKQEREYWIIYAATSTVCCIFFWTSRIFTMPAYSEASVILWGLLYILLLSYLILNRGELTSA